jgi:TolB protein
MVLYNAVGTEGKVNVFTIPASGGQEKNITLDNTGNDLDPHLSNTGQLVYSKDGANIYLMTAESQVIRLTSNGAGNREPAWSPDGKKIAYVSERDGNPEIYVMNADGSDSARLTRSPGIDSSPAWSPGGTQLALISDRDGAPEVYVMNLDGSEVTRFTFDMAVCADPAWSPDGDWLAYSSTRDGDAEIYRVSADRFQTYRVTFSTGDDLSPSWSPDGLWLAFLSDRQAQGKFNLFATTFDGAKVFAFFEEPPLGLQGAAWAPKSQPQP